MKRHTPGVTLASHPQVRTRLMITESRTQQGVAATLGSQLKSVSDGTGLVECYHDERVTDMSYSLKDFLQTFVAKHALNSGGEMVIDISPEEMQALGDFFVRGLCGWMLGLEAGRTRLMLVEITDPVAITNEDLCEEIDSDKETIN